MVTRFTWYWSERMHRGWENLRRRGAVHFVVVRGVLAWGGTMFAFFTLAPLLFSFPYSINLAPMVILKIGAICVVGGLAWGIFTWGINEFLYRRHAA